MFMDILVTFILMVLSSFLWRIRGGLDIWNEENVPFNKIWFAVFFAVYSGFYYGWGIEEQVVAFVACYTSYQLYGWGLYIGTLVGEGFTLHPESDKECELIDDILYPLHVSFHGMKIYLYQYPRCFGFVGTSLTGVIITFILGLYLINFGVMISGIAMGICYFIGEMLDRIVPDNKSGWNWGEWIFGAYLGGVFACALI